MGGLKVMPEAMPSIALDGQEYPVHFSVMAFQRWAEFRGTDFEGALKDKWTAVSLGLEGMTTLLRIGLECGEVRRSMVVGGSPREIGAPIIDRIMALYHPIEVGGVIASAWNLEDPEATTENPQTPDSANASPGDALSGLQPSTATE